MTRRPNSLRNVFKSVLTDAVGKGWALIATGSLSRIALGFLTSIVVVRALGPEDYGIYVVLVATINVVAGVAASGLSDAGVWRIASADPSVPRPDRGRAFFWMRAGSAALLGAACLLGADVIARDALGLTDAGGLLRLALLGFVASACSGATNTMLLGLRRYARLSSLLVGNALFILAAALFLELTGSLNLISVLIVLGVAPSVLTFAVGAYLLPQGWDLRAPDHGVLRSEARKLFDFGKWMWVAHTLSILASRVDLFFVNHWADAAPIVGIYGLARTLSHRAGVLNHSLYTVLLPTAAGLKRDEFRTYVRKGMLRGMLVCAALILFLPFAEAFISIAYGTAYLDAASLLKGLLVVTMIEALIMPVVLLLFAIERPRLIAALEGVRLVVLTILLPWLLASFGVFGAVAAHIAAAIASAAATAMIFRLRTVRRELDSTT